MKALRYTKWAALPHGARLAVLVLLLAVAGAVATSAWAQPGPGRGMGMMFQGSGERVGRMVDHMLDGLSASDAQRSEIKKIAQAAAADLKTQRDAVRGLHEKAAQLFAAPTVDAVAADTLRKQLIALHDQGSQRMLKAMLEISGVLTAEQRAKLGERFKQRDAQRRERWQRMEREHAPR